MVCNFQKIYVLSLFFFRIENNGEDIDRKKEKEPFNNIYQEPVSTPSVGGTIKVSWIFVREW